MNRIAFVFSQAPHGTTAGREGPAVVLSIPALSDQIALIFISDAVFQLTAGKKPQQTLARHSIATVGLLPMYDV